MYEMSELCEQLSVLFIDEYHHGTRHDPAKVICDQAYARSQNLSPKARTNSLNAMSAQSRAAAIERDEKNQPFRDMSECAFSKHTTLFPITRLATKAQLFRDGKSNWTPQSVSVASAWVGFGFTVVSQLFFVFSGAGTRV